MLRDRRWITKPSAILIAAALLAAGLPGCQSVIQDRVYRPDPMPAAIDWQGAAPREVSVTARDGLILRGYHWPAAGEGRDLILFFHGNGGNRARAAGMAAPLARHGYQVLVASYRGYGDNPGRPTEAGLMRDAAAFLAEARRLAPGGRIYLFGYSLGGAVALHLAAQEEVAGVATLGAFTSLRAAAPAVARALIAERYDNLAAIARVTEPILLLHGTADRTIPFAHAEALRRSAAGPARLLRIEGAGHDVDWEAIAPVIADNLRQMPRPGARTD